METTNKSYNPFKMWGSWVGFIVGMIISSSFLLDIKIETKTASVSEMLKLIVAPFIIPYAIIFGCWAPSGATCSQIVIVKAFGIITFLATSFLIGWAIHLIFRKLKN